MKVKRARFTFYAERALYLCGQKPQLISEIGFYKIPAFELYSKL